VSRRVILIAVAAAVVVSGIWYMTLWSPQQNALGAAHQRTTAAEQQASDLGLKVHGLEVARKDMPAKQAQLDILRAAIPDQPQLDQMIATVNNAAIASGVDLTALAPAQPPVTGGPGANPPRVVGGPTELNLSMSISGTYFQLTDFVNRLNAAPRLVVVDTLSLAGTADKSAKMSSALSAKMFVQPSAAGTK
jgi:Tfp pilus assembly protein PilO